MATKYIECHYCRRELTADQDAPVPAVGDDEAWEDLAEEHDEDCEWILTRAHNLNS